MNSLPVELVTEIKNHVETKHLPDALVSGIIPPLTEREIMERYLKAVDAKIIEFVKHVKQTDTLLWKSLCWLVQMFKNNEPGTICVTRYLDSDRHAVRKLTDVQSLFIRHSSFDQEIEFNGKKILIPYLTRLTEASFVLPLFKDDKIEEKRFDSYYIKSKVQVSFFYKSLDYKNVETLYKELEKQKIITKGKETYALLSIREIGWILNSVIL